MNVSRSYLLARDSVQTKGHHTLGAVYLDLICITHNCRYDLVSDAHSVAINLFCTQCVAWVRKIVLAVLVIEIIASLHD